MPIYTASAATNIKPAWNRILTASHGALIETAPPFYLFIPRDEKEAKQYQNYDSITDIFKTTSTGIKSHRDHFAFAFEAETIKTRIEQLIDTRISIEHLRETYHLLDTRDWKLESARQLLRRSYSFNAFLKPCLYRPFDVRWCYYGKQTMERPRPQVMHHLLAGENLGLTVSRSATGQQSWQDVFIVDKITEFGIMSTRPGNSAPIFPLYRYDSEHGTISENFNHDFRYFIDDRYGTKHSPEDILGCIYAVLHSPDYRRRYVDFLRSDFPRIPFPTKNTAFQRLARDR